jgi:predicted RNA-binding protein with PUA-like domain
MSYWLIKSEPSAFSIDDLIQAPGQITGWDGVRNYQARNYMRRMHLGDLLFFYHSNCKIPGIVGITKVVKLAYPDDTAWDPMDSHFDPKSSPQASRWDRVDVQFVEKFTKIIPLQELYLYPELKELPLVRKGNRLSIMPITEKQWHFVMNLNQ